MIEVLSPGNRSHDLRRKAAVYREAGITEVWYVDDRDRVLIVEARDGDAHKIERLATGPLISVALPGFWMDVTWLWADPMPNPRRCLEAILAGPYV